MSIKKKLPQKQVSKSYRENRLVRRDDLEGFANSEDFLFILREPINQESVIDTAEIFPNQEYISGVGVRNI